MIKRNSNVITLAIPTNFRDSSPLFNIRRQYPSRNFNSRNERIVFTHVHDFYSRLFVFLYAKYRMYHHFHENLNDLSQRIYILFSKFLEILKSRRRNEKFGTTSKNKIHGESIYVCRGIDRRVSRSKSEKCFPRDRAYFIRVFAIFIRAISSR